MIVTLFIILLVVVCILLFMQLPRFGKAPSGDRLRRIKQSPNFRSGQFQNLSPTPQLTEGVRMNKVLYDFLFRKTPRKSPSQRLPSKKEDLKQLSQSADALVWFGHSSYFMQLSGKKFLVDPVFSGNASPIPGTMPAFKGSDVYTAEDMPAIDYLLLTHDHWDHLDYRTLLKLKDSVKHIITGLGTAAHLERWGFDMELVQELDWHESVELDGGFTLRATPARHFSGRGLIRNRAIWLSFVLISDKKRIYIGGDSGYDTHFKQIGEQYGPFDLALLENGQYNPNWKYIHMMPEEVVQAAIDLDAKLLMPIHWGKFALSAHAWDEPIIRVSKAATDRGLSLLHPQIGEVVPLDAPGRQVKWWEGIG